MPTIEMRIEEQSIFLYKNGRVDIDVLKRHAQHIKLSPTDREKVTLTDEDVPHDMDQDIYYVLSVQEDNPLHLHFIQIEKRDQQIDIEIRVRGKENNVSHDTYQAYIETTIHPLIAALFPRVRKKVTWYEEFTMVTGLRGIACSNHRHTSPKREKTCPKK